MAGAWVPDGLQNGAVFLFGGSLRFGFRYQDDLKSRSSGSGDAVGSCITGIFSALWNYLRGNQYGADLRLHWYREGDRNRFLIGLQPLSRYAIPFEDAGRFRIFSGLSLVVPEAGLVMKDESHSGWYIRWVAPLSILLTRHFGLELRLTTGIVWEDQSRVFFAANLGIVVR